MQFPLNAVISFVGNTAATSAASSNISNQQLATSMSKLRHQGNGVDRLTLWARSFAFA